MIEFMQNILALQKRKLKGCVLKKIVLVLKKLKNGIMAILPIKGNLYIILVQLYVL